MTFDPSQIPSPSAQHGTDDLIDLNEILTQRMKSNPKGVMEYIICLREDGEAARQKVNQIEERLLRNYKSAQDDERRWEIERRLPGTSASDVPVIEIIITAFSATFFALLVFRIKTSSPDVEPLRKGVFTILWHCVISCSISLFCFTVGLVQGYLCTKISPSELQKQESTFAIKSRVIQLRMQRLRLVFVSKRQKDTDMVDVIRMRAFADYVGNMRAGSRFSNGRNIGSAYNHLLSSNTSCCLLFLVGASEFILLGTSEHGVTCVGTWARAGLALLVLVMAGAFWSRGKETGWCWGMGRLAQRLRKNCLSQSTGLEKGETAGRDRLEALVRELLQEEHIGEKEKSPEDKAYEKTVAHVIVNRIRC